MAEPDKVSSKCSNFENRTARLLKRKVKLYNLEDTQVIGINGG